MVKETENRQTNGKVEPKSQLYKDKNVPVRVSYNIIGRLPAVKSDALSKQASYLRY